MTAGQARYLAYLLRLWRVDGGGELVWRALLENAHTGERRQFVDLDALFEFLREQTGQMANERRSKTSS